MNNPIKYRLAFVSMVILLCSFSLAFAKEAGPANADTDPGLSGDASKESTPRSTRFDEQERYNDLYKEYADSIDRAKSDEERIRLRREFDEKTREYRNLLAEEKESSKKRDIGKERQFLKAEYHKNLRQMEKNHDKELRRLENECRKVPISAEKNWASLEPAIEPAMCQKKPLLEQEFKRDVMLLKDDYNASLRKLQKNR